MMKFSAEMKDGEQQTVMTQGGANAFAFEQMSSSRALSNAFALKSIAQKRNCGRQVIRKCSVFEINFEIIREGRGVGWGWGRTRNVKELKQMIMVVNKATSNFECTSQIQTKISIYASSI